MSVVKAAQSAVDWVNPVNWGPWGPLAVSQGWGPASHVGGGRCLTAGDARTQRSRSGLVGIAFYGAV